MIKIDWDNTKQFGTIPKTETFRERMAKAVIAEAQLEANKKLFADLQPRLVQELFTLIAKGEKLVVLAPIEYLTEEMSKSEGYSSESIGSFEICQKCIPMGDSLVFKEFEPHVKNIWFTNRSGQEVSINIGDTLGFTNLLKNTQIYPNVIKALTKKLEQENN